MELLAPLILIGGYFLPSIVGMTRSHKSKDAIFVLNLLLGWTILGWIVSLVWSFTGNTETTTQQPIWIQDPEDPTKLKKVDA